MKKRLLSPVYFLVGLQVSLVFDLEASACCGELVFMERYKEVLVELGQVEQKMESQSMSSSSSSSEGLGTVAASGTGRSRVGSSGRSTLQAIGSAAAAGSISFFFFLQLYVTLNQIKPPISKMDKDGPLVVS